MPVALEQYIPVLPRCQYGLAPAKLQAGTSIPGMVSKLCVKQGDRVEKDQVLAVIEAMKMETAITARTTGTVKTVRVKEGQPVKAKELLMVLEP